MITSNAQSKQDIFAYSVIGKNGSYIEIGANRPKKNNNTYELEVSHGWKGFSIELDTTLKAWWEDCPERTNPIYWDNAITFDYLSALKQNNLSTEIDYLSCDIEPPYNTFSALQAVINQGIKFKCITFEHDLYAYTEKDFNEISKNFLIEHGYKVAVTDVFWKRPENHFETWFVRNDVDFNLVTYSDWCKNI